MILYFFSWDELYFYSSKHGEYLNTIETLMLHIDGTERGSHTTPGQPSASYRGKLQLEEHGGIETCDSHVRS